MAELARRREILIFRSAAEREQLAQAYRQLRRPIRLVKLAVGLARSIKAHPELALGLTAIFVSGRSGKWGKLPLRLWMGWQMLRPLQAWWSRRRG